MTTTIPYADESQTETSPHKFAPLRFFDRFHQNGRCRHCVLPKYGHPVRVWFAARAIGDTTYYEWGTLNARKGNLENES